MVEALVVAGFNVNERVSLQPDTHVLPLHVAIKKVDDEPIPLENEIVEYLLTCGANPNVPMGLSQPLIYAVEAQKIWSVKLLLEHGAIAGEVHISGYTALAVACRLGLTEIVNLLFKYMPSTFHINLPVVFDTATHVHKSDTCLHIAVLSASTTLICYLLDQGANPSVKNKQNKSVYDLADSSDDVGVKYILNRYKASVDGSSI